MRIFTFIVSFLCLLCSSCDFNSKKEIKTVVDDFYGNYKAGDYRIVNKKLLSNELIQLIDRAALKQMKDAQKMKAMHSTDKPLMIEGDIYTSLYEGATAHKIETTTIQGTQALVNVAFVNNNFQTQSWHDTIELLKVEGYWKINDVRYDLQHGSDRSIKKVLLNFLRL